MGFHNRFLIDTAQPPRTTRIIVIVFWRLAVAGQNSYLRTNSIAFTSSPNDLALAPPGSPRSSPAESQSLPNHFVETFFGSENCDTTWGGGSRRRVFQQVSRRIHNDASPDRSRLTARSFRHYGDARRRRRFAAQPAASDFRSRPNFMVVTSRTTPWKAVQARSVSASTGRLLRWRMASVAAEFSNVESAIIARPILLIAVRRCSSEGRFSHRVEKGWPPPRNHGQQPAHAE